MALTSPFSCPAVVLLQFGGTKDWMCPCSAQSGGCPPSPVECRMDGQDILKYWDVPKWNKWREEKRP